jgi:hypothetical protein
VTLSRETPFDDLLARWRTRRGWAAALDVAAFLVVPAALAILVVGSALWVGGAFVIVLLLAVLGGLRGGRESARDRQLLARHVDRVLLPVQESSDLLAGSAPASLLGRLQRERALAALAAAEPAALLPRRRLRRALLRLAVAGSIGVAILTVGTRSTGTAILGSPSAATPAPLAPPRIESVEMVVHPPAYTGRPPRRLAGGDGAVEEGARVEWTVTTSGPVARADLVWVDGETPLDLDPAGIASGSRRIDRSQIYAIRAATADGRETRSPYARLTVIADQAPAVRVVLPAEPVVDLDPQAVGALGIEVEARDDHGVAAVDLVLTLVTGIGEGLTFDETRTPLESGAGERYRRRLDLANLGLAAGSELYVIAEARDRRAPDPNLGRSQPLRIRIGAPSARSADLARGVVLARPEDAFRSQRQIIIDTQRLIAEAPQLTRAEFERRSQSLGFDQMALRQRYGELLGEESESGGLEEEGEVVAPGDEAPLASLPQGFVHFHDSAESATFFSDPLRREMKRMIGQMWDAEGRLRIFDPRGALPYELEALRLLKEIQRRSRAYVPKTAGTQPQVLLERRLSGDLSKVRDVETRSNLAVPRRSEAERALDALRGARRGGPLPALQAALDEANAVLARAASEGQLADLDPLDAGREAADIVRAGGAADPSIWGRVEAGLWLAATSPPAAPAADSGAGATLLERYRAALGAEREGR